MKIHNLKKFSDGITTDPNYKGEYAEEFNFIQCSFFCPEDVAEEAAEFENLFPDWRNGFQMFVLNFQWTPKNETIFIKENTPTLEELKTIFYGLLEEKNLSEKEGIEVVWRAVPSQFTKNYKNPTHILEKILRGEINQLSESKSFRLKRQIERAFNA